MCVFVIEIAHSNHSSFGFQMGGQRSLDVAEFKSGSSGAGSLQTQVQISIQISMLFVIFVINDVCAY